MAKQRRVLRFMGRLVVGVALVFYGMAVAVLANPPAQVESTNNETPDTINMDISPDESEPFILFV